MHLSAVAKKTGGRWFGGGGRTKSNCRYSQSFFLQDEHEASIQNAQVKEMASNPSCACIEYICVFFHRFQMASVKTHTHTESPRNIDYIKPGLANVLRR